MSYVIYNIIVHPCIYQPLPCDHHKIISFQHTLSVITRSKRPSLFPFDCCKADHNGLNILLLNTGGYVYECFSDVESVWRFIKNSIMEGMNMYRIAGKVGGGKV